MKKTLASSLLVLFILIMCGCGIKKTVVRNLSFGMRVNEVKELEKDTRNIELYNACNPATGRTIYKGYVTNNEAETIYEFENNRLVKITDIVGVPFNDSISMFKIINSKFMYDYGREFIVAVAKKNIKTGEFEMDDEDIVELSALVKEYLIGNLNKKEMENIETSNLILTYLNQRIYVVIEYKIKKLKLKLILEPIDNKNDHIIIEYENN